MKSKYVYLVNENGIAYMVPKWDYFIEIYNCILPNPKYNKYKKISKRQYEELQNNIR